MKETHDGRKLRVCAVILAVFLTLASIALGVIQIVNAPAANALSEAGEAGEIIKGVLTLIVGPFLAFVICLVLRGFGTIVRKYENDEDDGAYKEDGEWGKPQTPKKRSPMETTVTGERKTNLAPVWGVAPDASQKPKPTKKRSFMELIGIEEVEDEERQTNTAPTANVEPDAPKKPQIICPRCSTEQDAGSTFCRNCGVKL